MLVFCLGVGGMSIGFAQEEKMVMMGLDTDSSKRNWESNAFFSRMADLTGVSFAFEQYLDAEEYATVIEGLEKRDAEKLPDVLFKAELTESRQWTLWESGVLMDMKPLLQENAPNLYALLQENPEWEKAITLPNGKIVALPLINTMEAQGGVWINRAWLSQLGVAMPTDAQSLYEALVAIKNGDPNKNRKADEVPLNATGVWELRWLLGLFGIVADDYNLMLRDGQVTFALEDAAYYDFVVYVKKLYDEGLLSEGAFSNVHAMLELEEREKDTLVSGALISASPYMQVDAVNVPDYEVLIPQSGVWRDMFGEVWGGTFAITTACKDPAAALRWVDALYAQDMVLPYAGVEGEDYTLGEAGWSWILGTYRTVENIRAEAIVYTGGTIPGLVPATFMKQADSDVDRHVTEQSAQLREISTQALPLRILTREESARVYEIQSVLGKEVDEGLARFITGEDALTKESWAAFVDGLEALGTAELIGIFEAALAR